MPLFHYRLIGQIPILMLKVFAPLIFLLFTLDATPQIVTTRTAPARLVKQFRQAQAMASAGQYERAIRSLENLLRAERTFIDARIELGNVYNQMERFAEAEKNYELALQLDSLYEPAVWYSLALVEMDQDKFDEAAEHFETFLRLAPAGSARRKRAEHYLESARFAAHALANPVPFEPKNLGPAINTPEDEYLPSLTADGSQLIYTAVRHGQEDFYISTRADTGWTVGKPIDAVNSPYNEGAQSIRADGRFLIFTICNRPGGLGSCDLYYSEYLNGSWTPVRNIGAPVNTKGYESLPSISADGQTLYFTSDRPGGYGGLDIWISTRTTDGRWSTPVNAGPVINTPEHEQAPFIHPDNQTLYFMSRGHPGLGKYDLFFSRKNPDGSWSKPVNLGYPINTRDNEGAFTVSLDGKEAYFASDMPGGFGKTDIYTFELYAEARPQPVTYVKAIIRDASTKKPLSARVEIYELQSGSLFTSLQTDDEGTFLSTLPAGKDYALHVSKDGYLFYSEHFALRDRGSVDNPFLIEVNLQAIGKVDADSLGGPVVLRNVFFETGSAALLPESKVELDKLVSFLEANPTLRIQINGHTDSVGSEEDNMQLSIARARAVYDYLVNHGIDAGRLSYKGFGESRPFSSNDTEEGRRLNRRTEFQVLRN